MVNATTDAATAHGNPADAHSARKGRETTMAKTFPPQHYVPFTIEERLSLPTVSTLRAEAQRDPAAYQPIGAMGFFGVDFDGNVEELFFGPKGGIKRRRKVWTRAWAANAARVDTWCAACEMPSTGRLVNGVCAACEHAVRAARKRAPQPTHADDCCDGYGCGQCIDKDAPALGYC